MKNTIHRALLIAVLTTSFSAFAVSGEKAKDHGKNNPDATNCAATAAANSGGQDDAQPADSKNKSQRQQQIERENQEWLHNLENMSGG